MSDRESNDEIIRRLNAEADQHERDVHGGESTVWAARCRAPGCAWYLGEVLPDVARGSDVDPTERSVMLAVTTTGDGWVFLENPANGVTLARARRGTHVVDALDAAGVPWFTAWLYDTLRAYLLGYHVTCPDCGNVGLAHAPDCHYLDREVIV